MDFAARKLGLEKLKSQQVTALDFGKSIAQGNDLFINLPTGLGANVAAVGQQDAVPVDCLSTKVIIRYRNGRYSF